jgi:hypothetical protein
MPRSVFSTQVYQLLDCIGTLSGIVASAKSSWSAFDAQGMRTNFRKGWQALKACPHNHPTSCLVHMPSTNPNEDNKHIDPEEVRGSTCHPRCCFGFSPIADRNALKGRAIHWLQIKEIQGGVQLLARFDRSYQAPAKTAQRIPDCRPSKREIATHRGTYAR